MLLCLLLYEMKYDMFIMFMHVYELRNIKMLRTIQRLITISQETFSVLKYVSVTSFRLPVC